MTLDRFSATESDPFSDPAMKRTASGRPSSCGNSPFPGHSSERMMGLEPTTFCMANASDRSYAFASVRSNHLFAATTGRASEPQRTRANAECSHCSHCDRCDVQLALPGGATPPERPPLTSASVAHQSSVGEDFAASPRDRIYEPYGLLRSGRLGPRRTCGRYGASDGAFRSRRTKTGVRAVSPMQA